MGKVNKLASIISIVSIFTIATSLTYYHNKLNAQEENIIIEKKHDFEITTTNVEIAARENNEGILNVSLKNISNRDLSDVVVELIHSGKKISEIYISSFSKGSEKKIELSLIQIENLEELKENTTFFNQYRLKEEKKFEDHSLEVIVSSYKSQTREEYKNLISTNTILNDETKKKILEKIDTANSIVEVEKLFKENKVYPEIKLSENHLIFDDKQDSIKVNKLFEQNSEGHENISTSQADNTEALVNEAISNVVVQSEREETVVPLVRSETSVVATTNTVNSTSTEVVPRTEAQPTETAVQPVGTNSLIETPNEVVSTVRVTN